MIHFRGFLELQPNPEFVLDFLNYILLLLNQSSCFHLQPYTREVEKEEDFSSFDKAFIKNP